jgi:uncharacterized protein
MAVGGERMSKEIDEEVRRNAHMLIGECLENLNEARLATRPEATNPQGTRRVGRNDPCPCGSGRKFKKCCMN